MNKPNTSQYETNLFILGFFPVILVIISFIFSSPKELFKGLLDLILFPDVLLVDYLEVVGLFPTLLNVGLTTIATLALVYIFKVPLNGPLISAIITIAGFAFMGKNIFNVWPIFIGGYIFSKYSQTPISKVFVPVYFVTTLGPVVTKICFGLNLNYYISIPLGILVGISIGFFVVPLANHLVKSHDGYNLYNIGFVGGIMGVFIASLMKAMGVVFETQSVLSTDYHMLLLIGLSLVFLSYIGIGYLINGGSFKGYGRVFHYTGRGFSHFIEDLGYGVAYMNIGAMGLISIIYVLIVQAKFNGPIAAGIITAAAFASFGKNPQNSIPVMLGIFLGSKLPIYTTNSTSVVISALFGTTLAPISGAYGPLAGLVAGMMHIIIAPNLVLTHGGMHLYNNGFSGGFVAMLLAPTLEFFCNKKSNMK